MKLITLIFITYLITGNLFADEYSKPPANCFEDNIYCSNTSISEISLKNNKHTAIIANFFALLSCDDYPTVKSVLDRFTAFSDLGDNFTDSDVMRLSTSIGLDPIMLNGEKILPHYASFYVKAPWPIKWMQVRELTHYKRTGSNEISFLSIVDKDHHIDGEEILRGSEGFKHKSGKLKVDYNKASCQYNITFTSTTVPSIELLPNISAPYLEAGMKELLIQIFQLR